MHRERDRRGKLNGCPAFVDAVSVLFRDYDDGYRAMEKNSIGAGQPQIGRKVQGENAQSFGAVGPAQRNRGQSQRECGNSENDQHLQKRKP